MYNLIFLILLSSYYSAIGSTPDTTKQSKDQFAYNGLFTLDRGQFPVFISTILKNKKYPPVHSLIEAGYWSDKLALVPYREYLSIGKQENWSRLAAQLLTESFNLAGKNAEETSGIITDKIRGGASVYGHLNLFPVELVKNRYAAGVKSSVAFTCKLPEAPFLLLFSEKNGLRAGSDLPLTHLGVQACMTTDIEAQYVKNIAVHKPFQILNKITSGGIECDNIYLINGMTVSLGNAMMDITATDGGIHLNSDGGELFADVHFRMRGSGICLIDDKALCIKREKGFPVSGIGFGLNSGFLLNGKHSSLAVGVNKLGPMIWGNMKEAEISLKTANISIAELFQKNYKLFDSDKGGEVTGVDSGEIMHSIKSSVGWLPLSVNVFYEYCFYIQKENVVQWGIPKYVIPSVSYTYNLTPWPGIITKQGVTIRCEAGFINGVIPLSAGWSFGYGKKIASMIAAGVSAKEFNVQIGYESIGTACWYPKRGCTVNLQIGVVGGG